MARIRSIKPEFWTDEKIVGLPFQARLLFIGLWNFADDSGALDYSPDRVGMQIFPGDPDTDISGLLDLLQVSGLIELWVTAAGEKAISVRNWSKHQKIDNPSKKSVLREDYRKVSIPSEARVAVAKKYGCKPGSEAGAECFYCGMPGKIQWWNGSRGKPTKWITLSDLEFDHFRSEHSGGESTNQNIVLACRACNRAKREFDALQFFVERNPSVNLDSPSEDSTLDQGSRSGGEGIKEGKGAISSASPPERKPAEIVFDQWRRQWNHPDAKLDPKRRGRIEARLKTFSVENLCDAIAGFRHSDWHTGLDPKGGGKVYDKIETLLRDDSQVEEGMRLLAHPPRPPPKPEQLSPVERVLRANGVNFDGRVVAEQFGSGNGSVGDADGHVRDPPYAGFRRIGS